VLPKAKDVPAMPSQRSCIISVACLVFRQLLEPVSFVAIWLSSVPPATMPKASIHENHNFFFSECEVRPPNQGQVASPSGDPVCAQDGGESNFR
jgi:hypothetical protein